MHVFACETTRICTNKNKHSNIKKFILHKSIFKKNAYKPSSPYSASKASSDHLVRAWHRTYGLPVVITNCSNNYGPFQFPEKLIPLVILNALEKKPLPIYGDGKQIRDWLYVEDHIKAILCVIDKGKIGETYNIGGDNQTSNLDEYIVRFQTKSTTTIESAFQTITNDRKNFVPTLT